MKFSIIVPFIIAIDYISTVSAAIISSEASVVSEYASENAYIFLDSISNPKELHLQSALNALKLLARADVEMGILGETSPLLHHMLNLYRLSDSASVKSQLIDIMLHGLERGFDAQTPYKSDPPLIYKSIMLKELNLTKSLIDSSPQSVVFMVSHQQQWLAQFLATLYSIPSEPVPLAKLLLHADTIASQNIIKSSERMKQLLDGAMLGKPNVKPVDLALHSSTYNRIVTELGESKDEGGKSIKLLEIIQCLDEVASKVHQSFLDALLKQLDSNTIADRIETVLHFLEVLTSLRITDGDMISRLTTNHYDSNRNALHYLCISGGHVMLNQLTRFISELVKQDLIGTKSSTAMKLIQASLTAKDRRSHSPVSYAIMRFKHDSPIVKALELLNQQLDFELDDAFHVSTKNVGNEDINGVKTADRDLFETGGWSAFKRNISMDDRCDVWEEFRPSLLSNKEFFLRFINTGTPVIFRGVASKANVAKKGTSAKKYATASRSSSSSSSSHTMQELLEVFQKSSFVNNYGRIKVPASTIPYSESFGIKSTISTLEEVANSQNNVVDDDHNNNDNDSHHRESFLFSSTVHHEIKHDGSVVVDRSSTGSSAPLNMSTAAVPLYTFCTPSEQWKSKLYRDVPIPCSLQRQQNSDEDSGIGTVDAKYSSWSFELQFYLGSAGTGAPVHFHGHALNTLAYGEKKWVLFPPVHSFYSTVPALRYFQNPHVNASSFSPLYCTQQAGDILYVPALWGHGTLNTQQSIGVAHEFTVESFGME